MEEATSTTGGAAAAAAAAAKPMNVLVAIDDSDESFEALRWVIDKLLKQRSTVTVDEATAGEAQEYSNYTAITIVHVVEPLPRYAYPGGYVIESSSKSQEQNAARILSRAFEMCRDNSLKAKTVILEGDAKDRICGAVEEMNIDLLVVGSRGLGQIKRAFLGSVSDYCVHHAKCAVLVVKPPAKKKSA